LYICLLHNKIILWETKLLYINFKQVDNNVTRHIRDELSYDDWAVMILHYLGLDHIGHVEGPFGASIKPKLQEMDKIIAQIAQKVQDWVSMKNYYNFLFSLLFAL